MRGLGVDERERRVAYEIRVVFQTMEAYQSAVERLYDIFGVEMGEPPAVTEGGAPNGPAAASAISIAAPDVDEEPAELYEGYSFVVEDRTA